MKVNRRRWFVAAFAVVLFPGCISQQAQQIEQDVTALQDSLRVVYARQDALYDRFVQMHDRMDEQDTRFDQFCAEHKTDVGDLESRVSVTETNVGQAQERMVSLSQRMDALDRRVSGARISAPADTTRSAPLEGMTRAYDRAYLDFSKGNYELAILGFTEYLKDYPQSERADNAQYWIGECYYVQNDYPSAIEAFQKVLDRYSDGNKAPGAMLKMGYALLGLGREPDATRQLKTVIERYPGTLEAEHAKARLLSLSQ